MQSIRHSEGKKLHTRTIEVSTCDYDEQRIMVEGTLKDVRFQDSHVITGEIFPRGVMHHMAIRLLINYSTLLIEDIDVELISVPREICQETINCLASIKGLSITKGFTLKVKDIAGGNKGCAHLVELLQAMAPAVFQGFAAHHAQKPLDFTPVNAKMIIKLLVDTCHAWREDGPFVEMLKKKLKM